MISTYFPRTRASPIIGYFVLTVSRWFFGFSPFPQLLAENKNGHRKLVRLKDERRNMNKSFGRNDQTIFCQHAPSSNKGINKCFTSSLSLFHLFVFFPACFSRDAKNNNCLLCSLQEIQSIDDIHYSFNLAGLFARDKKNGNWHTYW